MSAKHPIVAVTGASGSGLSTVRHAFKFIFRRLGIRPVIVHGDCFRRYTERQFTALLEEARTSGRHISWFGPECNHFPELETFFKSFGETGSGVLRDYAHNAEHAQKLGVPVGEFTPWQPLSPGNDLLFYEGQHGGLVAETWTRRKVDARHFPPEVDRRIGNKGIDIAQHVDLLLGVAPAINLEWIQKIHRDCAKGHCAAEESVDTILRRMDDYIHYIVPQFGLTDINIQRMPLVDTSDPFTARDVPTADESIYIFHFRDRKRFDLLNLKDRIPSAHMTRPTTMMVPGGDLKHALEVICGPILEKMMDRRREALAEA